MVDYIIHDFGEGRTALDSTIGAMIVCDSSEQAREVDRQLNRFQIIHMHWYFMMKAQSRIEKTIRKSLRKAI